ncbi:DUF3108 domain-containing protein [Microbulbifer discodermiae]|uniref:DUF3108 domain-containing protein n=1 Tax=Microbulbifer sp. 2201CG32-9 TaxID=3232309 RepID=UPI00345C5EF5
MPLRLLTALLFISALPALGAELRPFNAVYQASYNGLGVEATRKLTGRDNNWRLDFNADSIFAGIDEYSRFVLHGDQLRPLHYEYKKSGLGRGREIALNFEAEQRRVVNLTNPKRSLEEVPQDVQDKLSYQLQLALDIAAGKEKLEYRVADGRKIRAYKFSVVGTETLQTPMGQVETIKVQRLREGDAQRETVIWFAPAWNYALVKLWQQEEDGKSYQIALTELTIDGKNLDPTDSTPTDS